MIVMTVITVPFVMVMIILVDCVFTATAVTILPILLLTSIFRCCECFTNTYKRITDWFSRLTIGLGYQELRVLRSQRTIIQMQLESVPQILFQFYLL